MKNTKHFCFVYNDKEKKEFLKEKQDSGVKEASLHVMKSRLNKIDKYETWASKYILDWVYSDIEDFLFFLNAKNTTSAICIYTLMRQYGEFLSKKQPSSSIPPFISALNMMEENNKNNLINKISEYVNLRKKEEILFTKKEYIRLIEDERIELYLRCYFIFSWNGIPISDILEIKESDINFDLNTIRNKKGEIINITEEEMSILKTFLSMEKEGKTLDYSIEKKVVYEANKSNSDLFFKPITYIDSETYSVKRSPKKIARNSTMDANTKRAFALHGKQDSTPQDLDTSGKITRIVEKKGLTLEKLDQIITNKEYNKIRAEFNNSTSSLYEPEIFEMYLKKIASEQ